MPSVSAKQQRFMGAVAHNPKFAREVGVSQAVGREFNDADYAKDRGAAAERKRKAGKIAAVLSKR